MIIKEKEKKKIQKLDKTVKKITFKKERKCKKLKDKKKKIHLILLRFGQIPRNNISTRKLLQDVDFLIAKPPLVGGMVELILAVFMWRYIFVGVGVLVVVVVVVGVIEEEE